MNKHCKPAWCSARESCDVEIASAELRVHASGCQQCGDLYIRPNSQKDDGCCEYTREAPEPLLLQIPIDMLYTIRFDFFIFILLSRESDGGAMRRTNPDSLRSYLCFQVFRLNFLLTSLICCLPDSTKQR